jgi:ABC-type nitrate/sulfonate/bicarbonate transport system ATPase subunit
MAHADDSIPIERSDDERLRQLLALEGQLQDRVRAARVDAAARIRQARADMEQRVAVAREAAARADADEARAERLLLDEALAAIDAAHRRELAALAGISDRRVDQLARWAISQVLGRNGEPV